MIQLRFIVLFFLIVGCVGFASAQSAPYINSITPKFTYPGDTIVITGSGFDATPANLKVWFGHAQGSIISSSSFSIKVATPPQAKYNNVEVINLATKLSAKSDDKMQFYFSGSNPAFSISKMISGSSMTNASQLYDVCSCDFNLDGKPDIAATKFTANEIQIYKNSSTIGAVSFTQQNAVVGFFTGEITCGDLDGDGKPEIVASRSDGGLGGNMNTIFVLPNTSTIGGAISFGAAQARYLPSNIIARVVNIRDLDADGKPDIIVSNNGDNSLFIFNNLSSGGTLNIPTNATQITIPGASPLYGLEVQDFDGDSKPDIAVTEFQSTNMYLFRNISAGSISFSAPSTFQLKAVGDTLVQANEMMAADLNEDGKMDLVHSDWFNGKAAVWLNNTVGTNISFAPATLMKTSSQPHGIDIDDIDGDQDLDILIASRATNNLEVFLNNGNNSSLAFSSAKKLVNTKSSRNVLLADFDGDAKPEIVSTSRNTSNQFSLDVFRNTNCFMPVLLTTSPQSICPGQFITLQSQVGYGVNFDWKLGGVTAQNTTSQNIWTNQTGTYTVNATSEGGSCSNLASGNIVLNSGTGTVPADPTISASTVCTGQTLTLSTNEALVVGASYNWTGPNNFSSTTSTKSVSISNAGALAAGEYSLQIVLGNCKSNVKYKIADVIDMGVFGVSSTSTTNSTCQGVAVILSTRNDSNFNYQWIQNSTDLSGQTLSNLSVSSPTPLQADYKVRVTDPSIAGCTVTTASVTVKILAPPVLSLSNSGDLCLNQSVSYNSSTSTFDANGTKVYAWDFKDGTTASTSSPSHTFTSAGTYNVTLVASYLGVTGCTDTKVISTTINTSVKPVITPSLTSICPTETSSLSVSGATFNSLVWEDKSTTNPRIVSTGGTYKVVTRDNNNCKDSTTVNITGKPGAKITAVANQTKVFSGQQVFLTATGADNYAWTPTDYLDNPSSSTPVATPLATVTYTVVGTFNDTNLCGGVSDPVTIEVAGATKYPNVFTPNGDSQNDTWGIPNAAAMADCTLVIFDKSGVKVLEQRANEAPWDGTYNGKPVPPGTYYYIISCPDNKSTGNILVAR